MMTKQKKIQQKRQKWEEKKEFLIARQELQEDIKEIKQKNKKHIPTSKFLMAFLFLSCSAIEIYTMIIIVYSMKMGYGADFGPLQMLITAVVAEVIGFAIYSLKASKENSIGGIVYESAMRKIDQQIEENQGEAQG